MLSVLEPSEKTRIIAKINEFSGRLHFPKLTEDTKEAEILGTLLYPIRIHSNDYPLSYLLFAGIKINGVAFQDVTPIEILKTLIELQSLFADTKQPAFLLDVIVATAQRENNRELLESLGYMSQGTPNQLHPPDITDDKDLMRLHSLVKTKDALFELAKSCTNTTKYFSQFTQRDFTGRTVLHYAAINNTLEALITYFPSPHLFDFLMQVDYAGKTPLWLMAELHPIDRLARVLKRLPTNEIRENTLLFLDSEGLCLLERCISSEKSPLPLLRTLDSNRCWQLLWQTLPNKDITLLQAILLMSTSDVVLRQLFDRTFQGFNAETKREDLLERLESLDENRKTIFAQALEKSAFVASEMLAFFFEKDPKRLIKVLDLHDAKGLSLLQQSCVSAEKFAAVAMLYPTIESLISALGFANNRNYALERVLINRIFATAISFIPPHQRLSLLYTRSNNTPVLYNYVVSLFDMRTAPSDTEVNSVLYDFLSVLTSLPVRDFMSALQSVLYIYGDRSGFSKILKYERWGEMTLNNEQQCNRTECFVNAWYQMALEPDRTAANDKLRTALTLLQKLFPIDVLQKIDHPRPQIEAKHLIRVLLSIVVMCHETMGVYDQGLVENFLKTTEAFYSVHRNNDTVDTQTIKTLVKLIKKLLQMPHEYQYPREFGSISTGAIRQWFYNVRQMSYHLQEKDCNNSLKLIKQLIAHFDWLSEQNLFSDDGINFRAWILCLRKIVKVNTSFLNVSRVKATLLKETHHFDSLQEHLALTEQQVRDRYLSPMIDKVNIKLCNRFGSSDYYYTRKLKNHASNDEITEALNTSFMHTWRNDAGTHTEFMTLFEILIFETSWHYFVRDTVIRLPDDYNPRLLNIVLCKMAGDKRHSSTTDLLNNLRMFLEIFSNKNCRDILSSYHFNTVNSLSLRDQTDSRTEPYLLRIFVCNRRDGFFQIFNQVYRKFFSVQELKALLEWRNAEHRAVLDDILYLNTAVFDELIAFYADSALLTWQGAIEYLCDQFETGYDRGVSSLQQLATVKDQSIVAQATANLAKLYGGYNGLLFAMMREDGSGQTCLHHAAKHWTLKIWLSLAANHGALGWLLGQLIHADQAGYTPLMIEATNSERLVYLPDYLDLCTSDDERCEAMTTSNHQNVSLLVDDVKKQMSLLWMLRTVAAPRRWPLLLLPMNDNSTLTVFQALIAGKLDAENQLPPASVRELLDLIQSLDSNHQLEALQYTVDNVTLLEHLVLQKVDVVASENSDADVFLIKNIISFIGSLLDINAAVFMSILRQVFVSDCALLSAPAEMRNLFYKVVIHKCSGKLGADQNEALRAIIGAFRNSSVKESVCFIPVITTLELLTKTETDATHHSNEPDNIENNELPASNEDDLTNILIFLKDIFENYNIVTTLKIAACFPVAIRKTIVDQLCITKSFMVSAMVNSFCVLASGKNLLEKNYSVICEIIAYAKVVHANDNNLSTLIGAISKLSTPEPFSDLFEECTEDLPNEKVCRVWLEEIYTLIESINISNALHPLDFFLAEWICYYNLYTESSVAEKLLVLRKAAVIFKSMIDEFNDPQQKLLDLVLMPATNTSLYSFAKSFSEHDKNPAIVRADRSTDGNQIDDQKANIRQKKREKGKEKQENFYGATENSGTQRFFQPADSSEEDNNFDENPEADFLPDLRNETGRKPLGASCLLNHGGL